MLRAHLGVLLFAKTSALSTVKFVLVSCRSGTVGLVLVRIKKDDKLLALGCGLVNSFNQLVMYS